VAEGRTVTGPVIGVDFPNFRMRPRVIGFGPVSAVREKQL